jgi:hypothetical protein
MRDLAILNKHEIKKNEQHSDTKAFIQIQQAFKNVTGKSSLID